MPDMKPSFALNLTEDGITLLHRMSRGWMDVGRVAFSDPDLPAAMEYLRSTALGLSPTGVTTKLIIPESQILYLQIDAIGPDDASRRAQIEVALDGRTPYALDELVYDWAGSGPTVTVAVVARETLAEAEAFATEHRFNPVAFVAAPERDFEKEPFFGASKLAPGLLAAGEQVEADAAPVTIIARDLPQVDAPVVAEAPAPEVPEPVAPEPVATEPVAPEPVVPAPHVPKPFRPMAEPVVPEPVVPEPVVPEPVAPEPVVPEPALPEPAAPELPIPALPEPEVPAPVVPEPEVPPPELPLAEPEPMPPAPMPAPEPEVPPAPVAPANDPPRAPLTMAKSRPIAPFAEEAEAPMAVDVPPEDSETAEEAVQGKSAYDAPKTGGRAPLGIAPRADDDDLPPPLSSAALMAFSTRRPAEGAPRPLGGAEPSPIRPELGGNRPAAPAATRPATAKLAVERPAAARPVPKFSYDDPLPPPTRLPGDPPTPPASVVNKAGKGLRSLSTLVTAPSIPGTRKKKPIATGTGPAAAPTLVKPSTAASTLAPVTTLAAPLDTSPAKASVTAAAQSLARQKASSPDSIARGLSARALPQRGKPKYLGLILTGILLLLLALVAAWSSFYLTRGDDVPSDVEVAAFDASGDAEALADGQLPEDGLAPLAALAEPDDLPVNVDLADLEPVVAPEPVLADVAPAPLVAEPAPQTAVQDEAAAAVQPDAVGQDEIFLAGMDTPPSLSDPLVLPPPAASGDAPPAAQMPPPPFGTVYQFDADGRIVPTAEGIMTPEGVMLVAGKPARVPPQRPASVEAAAAVAVPAAAVADAVAEAVGTAQAAAAPASAAPGEPLPAETFAADPTLSEARPRVRPEGLAPAAAAAGTEDDASLAPAEDSRFASLRPRLRPQAVLAAGEAARRASEAASLAVEAAVAEAAVASAEEANLSPLAVSVSRVPAPRPRDLSRAVEAAVAAATRRAEPEVVAAAAPSAPQVADEADDEPEVEARSAAPRIPSTANVAKQATFVNAINLGKLNLIGVYGTQSKRYALVRQPNGRYRKVRVGDNIDGGRVQAITASEVRYQKGGRMLALSMPAG